MLPQAKRILPVFLLPLLILLGGSHPARAFLHPGISLTAADLNDVKTNLNKLPWSSGYAALVADGSSSTNYTMQGPFTYVNRNNSGNYDHENQWKNDMQAIYNLSRMWYLTGDGNFAKKSHDILLAWANTMTNFGGIEAALDLGDYAYRYGGGADILRGTWPGWTTSDTLIVSNFFRNVYLPATGMSSTTYVAGPSNKGALQLVGGLACAVFMDDTNLFNQVLYVYRTSASCGLHNNCLTSGEMGETGRDQGHAYGDLLQMSFMAEVFWKQGVDIYSEDDNRLLACGEYYGRNNLSPAAQYITYGTTDYIYWVNSTNAGGSSAGGIYSSEPMMGNILRSAYVVRKNMTAPWMVLKRATQSENEDSFCFLKSADISTATAPPAIVYPTNATVTTGLINNDIGTVGVSGSGFYYGGNWTVNGGGSQVETHSADSCHFVYKLLTGDCTMIAKVNSVSLTAATAKAGVMIRDSLSSSAGERAWVAITASTTIEAFNHGYTQIYGGSNWETFPYSGVSGWLYAPTMPYWVKIERLGNTISTYVSLDGTSWEVTTVAYYGSLPSSTYVGLFVCALNTSTACTGVFSNVSITSGNNGNVTVPPAPYLVYASPDAGRVPLRWLQSFGATNYTVLRSTTNGGSYSFVASVTNASYIDTNVTPNTTYYYIIRASNSAGTSTNSPQESATTQPLPQPPTGLVALAGNARATLFWVAADGAASYNVKRSTTSGSGYVTVTNVTGTSFVNTNLANGTTYYYVVSTVNGAGEGLNSSEAGVTPKVSAATLFWSGAVNGTWDTSTANWLNAGVSATYSDGNSVVLDDSASANTTINLSANRSPGIFFANNAGDSYTIGGSAIAGTGKLIKQNLGTLTLNNASSFSGGSTIYSGTVTVGNNSALGTGTVTLSGGTLFGGSSGYTLANSIQAVTNTSSTIDCSGNLALNGNLTGGGIITRGASATLTLYLGGDNSGFTGTYQDQNNGNSITRWNSPNAGSANARWIFNQAQINSRTTPNFGTGTIQFGSISGGGFIYQNSSGTATLQVGALGLNDTFSGSMQDGAGIIALTKVGTGTLTLNGANNYSGQTTVNNGELVVSTVFAGNGNFVVANGATLGVTNASSGSAAANNLSVAGGSTLEFQNVASTTTPLIAASSVTVNGGCTVRITGTSGLVVGNAYPLVSDSGAFSGTFTNLQLQMPAGWGGTLVSNAHQVVLSVVALPAAPASVAATAGDAQVVLTWSAVSGATGYNVKSSLTNGDAYTVVGANVSSLGFTNTGLVNGTVYYYAISALNPGGEGTNSVQVNARPVSLLATNLTLNVSNNQIQLNWPADHTGWRLEVQTNSLAAGLGTNWFTVLGSMTTNQVVVPCDQASESVFFRMVFP